MVEEDAMEQVVLAGLSRAAAEAALVEIWCELARCHCEAPKIGVEIENGNTVRISLTFPNSLPTAWPLFGGGDWRPGHGVRHWGIRS
jgi:hypothetical protein